MAEPTEQVGTRLLFENDRVQSLGRGTGTRASHWSHTSTDSIT